MNLLVRAAAIAVAIALGAAHFSAERRIGDDAPADGEHGVNDDPPAWAYPVKPPAMPAAAPPTDDGSAKHVPGSAVALTLAQTRDAFAVPDWRPDEHPPMPDVVSHGRSPSLRACGYCHLPNGFGRPENSSLAGLPAAYIAQQMADYRNGLRTSSEPRMGPPAAMLAVAKAATEDDSCVSLVRGRDKLLRFKLGYRFSVTFCARQFHTSPTHRLVSLRQSSELVMPNSRGRRPALPKRPAIWPVSWIL